MASRNKMRLEDTDSQDAFRLLGYKRSSLGTPSVFYLPAKKINSEHNLAIRNELHEFLLSEFGGYTAERGDIHGYWIDGTSIEYDENVKYTVALGDTSKIKVLELFVADIGRRLGEKAIYFETGKDSWLIHTGVENE